MKGYNKDRINKPHNRKTGTKVLSVLNKANRWVRVSAKSIDFYTKELNIEYQTEIDEHRIEYFDSNNKCVMVYEF